jgi:hypothetical protein
MLNQIVFDPKTKPLQQGRLVSVQNMCTVQTIFNAFQSKLWFQCIASRPYTDSVIKAQSGGGVGKGGALDGDQVVGKGGALDGDQVVGKGG